MVARTRKLFATRRIGHTGTLDPFATGLLVLCLNRATRLVQYLTADVKEYLAVARFGMATDTGDLTGSPLPAVSSTAAQDLTLEQLNAAAQQLKGRIKQLPPMYSAKKIGGVKLYELARQGKQIERTASEVEILDFDILRELPTNEATTKDFAFRVRCSSGTYVRVLAEDLAQLVGSQAHLRELQRTHVGNFQLAQALSLEQLAELPADERYAKLLPMRAALTLPELCVNEAERSAIAHGQTLRRPQANGASGLWKLCDPHGELLAIASYETHLQAWQPRVVLCEPIRKP